MKKLIVILLLLTLSVVTAYAMSHKKAPIAKGDAVITFITETSPYQQWALWPGKGKLYKGQHPHGAFLTTYVSKNALAAIEAKTGSLPDGSMVVKENYSPDKKLAAITVMYKKKGYAPEDGDWFWLKYGPDGKIMKEGKVGGCIGCHKPVADNDWIFTGPIK
jgi:hypothetical protein